MSLQVRHKPQESIRPFPTDKRIVFPLLKKRISTEYFYVCTSRFYKMKHNGPQKVCGHLYLR